MHRLVITVVVILASVVASLAAASGNCYTFYSDLCLGPYSCMCTLNEPCGSVSAANYSRKLAEMKKLGGCTGKCRTVVHDRCTGPDSCMQDSGECIVPTPVPPNPNTMLGVDFASEHSQATIDCLVQQHNRSFGIVRAHHSNGGVDPNAPVMIKKMRLSGMKKVDAYLFPCTTFNAGHTAQDQVNKTVNYLIENSAVPDRIWFDIEWNPYDKACDWKTGDTDYNCKFIKGLVDGANAATKLHNIPFGFYSGKAFWSEYLDGCDAGKDFPLWYAAYDDTKSFAGWTTYGGWTAPKVKQYTDKLNICGVNWDADWAPNGLP